MKILFCCDSYYPSVGGVQIVLQQIAERLYKRGHDITIATSMLKNRNTTNINGIKIKEFDVSGNAISGLYGEIEKYRDYLFAQDYDILVMKAAQSWSFDSMMDHLNKIKKRKVFIPCGFSGLYYSNYKKYFEKMPDALKEFDHLIFYADDYRDVNLAKEHNITNYSIIPNGASEIEFSVKKDKSYRERYGIDKKDILLMTVGTFTGSKGHTEVASAFQLAKLKKPAKLILNGNLPDKKAKFTFSALVKEYLKMGPKSMFLRIFRDFLTLTGIKKTEISKNWNDLAREVNSSNTNKRIIITNQKREDLVQCFLNADLFVFASNIEYSPLVLYESAAAGLPFLSVPVGNAIEIAKWTEGGIICPADSNINGRVNIDPQILANHISELLSNENELSRLSEKGKKNWKLKFTWDIISYQYEKVLVG